MLLIIAKNTGSIENTETTMIQTIPTPNDTQLQVLAFFEASMAPLISPARTNPSTLAANTMATMPVGMQQHRPNQVIRDVGDSSPRIHLLLALVGILLLPDLG